MAGVQNVRHSSFSLLLPQLVGVGREKRLSSFSSNLQSDSTDSQHPPHGQDEEVFRLERHSHESRSEVCVECSPEDVEGDVGEAGEDVTVNSQHHTVGAHNATRQDVQHSQAAHEDDWDEQSDAREGHPEHPIVSEHVYISQRSEECPRRDKEAQHKSNTQHTEHEGPKSPPGRHQEDATDAASYSSEDQADIVLQGRQSGDQDVKEEPQENEANEE